MELITVILIGVMVCLYFYVKTLRSSDSKSLVRKKVFNEWEGWIELSDYDFRPLLKAKVLKKHNDSIWFGYGYLVKENLNDDLLKDLNKLDPVTDSAGRIFIQFGIDALASNVVAEFSKEEDSARIELSDLLENKDSLDTVKLWITSLEVRLTRSKDETLYFDKLWNEARFT